MHNDHYTKLADYEPFKVYEAWARGNEELFKENYTLGGYYLATLKYLARIESKDDPVKNLEKVAVYVQEMINAIKRNSQLKQEFIDMAYDAIGQDGPPHQFESEWIEWRKGNEPPAGQWIEWEHKELWKMGCKERAVREERGGYTRWNWDNRKKSSQVGSWEWGDFPDWGRYKFINTPEEA